MASESTMWEALRGLIRTLDPIRIEDKLGLGVPDVNFTRGWIELKYMHEWPVREGTEVKIDHFTPEQRAWILRRTSRPGGRVYLILKVGEFDWLLFDGRTAAKYLGNTTKRELYKVALDTWTQQPKAEDLIKWLVR